MSIHIRPERPADFPAIHELVRLAFATAEHSDGDEHFFVDRLRASPDYIPELALVAEEVEGYGESREGGEDGGATATGRLVGHIMFTTVQVGTKTVLSLAPLSILPGHQSKGVGTALVRHGHELARALGWEFVILVGHAAYYPRFGYKPAAAFGTLAPFDVPAECFMVINLQGGPEHLPGMAEYASYFFPKAAE